MRQHWILFIAVLTLLSSALSGITHAENWPGFLGPHRNGISSETNLIDAFGDDGPKIAWRVPGGVGMSGISVVGQRAVTMWQDDESQFVAALHAESGEMLWKTPVAPAYENSMGHGPRGTPAIDANQVFAFTGEGILVALSLKDGELQWKTNAVVDHGGKPSEYGMACSPLVVGDLVITNVGAPGASVCAFDRMSGKERWTAGKSGAAGYSSPALLTIGGMKQIVAFTGFGAMGIVPLTGDILWSYPYETDYDCNIATPIVVDGYVLISAGESHGTTLLKVPTQAGGNASVVWESLGNRASMRNEWQTSILLDGVLFGVDNVGSAGPVSHLACLNAKDGSIRWTQKRFGKSNLIAADGKLWFTTMKGELVIVNANPDNFEELGRALIIGKTRQAPALANGHLFIRDDKEIVCIDIRK